MALSGRRIKVGIATSDFRMDARAHEQASRNHHSPSERGRTLHTTKTLTIAVPCVPIRPLIGPRIQSHLCNGTAESGLGMLKGSVAAQECLGC